jgi:predicted AlkP superfamily phosphohydrolase/phosphomutase
VEKLMLMEKVSKKRTVIIGIDGVPFRLMDELSKNNTMPNFAKLRKHGVFRKMASSIPEISSVSWTSIITGKNPAEHGIFGFTDLEAGTYNITFPNFTHLKAKTYWQRDSSKRYVIINVPSTYPAQELNGLLVSGFVSPDFEKSIYPKSLIPKLREMNYQIDVDASKGHTSKDALLEELFMVHDIRMSAIKKLWDSMDWDVFMIVFTGSDRIGHFLWDAYEDPGHKHHKQFLKYFSEIDKALGEILSRMNSQDNLVICSDHGMELTEANVNVNQILKEKGWLVLGEQPNLHYNNIIKGTKAFSMDPGRIYINRTEKYPKGSVQPDEVENIIKEMIDLFTNLEIEGKKVMKAAYRKEDIYKGPHLDNAPDIILLANKGFNLKSSLSDLSGESTIKPGILTGKHSQEDAFLFVKGKEHQEIVPKNPSVEDITEILQRL